MPPKWQGLIRQRLENRKVRIAVGVGVVVAILVLIMIICLSIFVPRGNRGSPHPTETKDHEPGLLATTTDGGGATTPQPGSKTGAKAEKMIALYQSWFKGDGTYYGSEGEGTCQIAKENLPPAARNSKYLAALNSEQFMNSAACSMCFRLKAEGKGLGNDPIKGDFIVFIKDLCPECKEGDVDLAIDGDGRWDIQIRAVQCPVGNTFIQYEFQGSNPFYLKLQVRNVRVPPQKVEVQNLKGAWIKFKLSKDGHWEGSSTFDKKGDLPVRLMSITGVIVNDVIPRLENEVVMEGKKKVQFPVDSSLPNSQGN